MRRGIICVAMLLGLGVGLAQEARFITLASTTSTEQSGLFAVLLPLFKRDTGIDVRVVALGSGQALALAARGDADAVLAHDPAGEAKFIADGHGLGRRDVMFNDFILIGPKGDPAGIRGHKRAAEALQRIAAGKAPFVSRGDKSGTHAKERLLWKAAAAAPGLAGAGWYRELGSGMGETLNAAAAMEAYTLADRGTWLSFANRRNLDILVEGDPALFNPYSSILVNPAKGAHIKAQDARTWHEWLISAAGQSAIAAFRINGEPLFFPAGSAPRS